MLTSLATPQMTASATRPHISPLSLALLTATTAFLLAAGPLATRAHAQDDKVYGISELSNPPKLSTATAARLIQESYPEDLKRKRVGGMVELQLVVDAQGNVVAGSVEVVDATQTALAEAAKKVAARFTFEPGKLNGTKVKTKVVLPIVYKAM
jgi:protein TonB